MNRGCSLDAAEWCRHNTLNVMMFPSSCTHHAGRALSDRQNRWKTKGAAIRMLNRNACPHERLFQVFATAYAGTALMDHVELDD